MTTRRRLCGDAHSANDGSSDSDDDAETRRMTYLRRHWALIEQTRRLETERRASELEGDRASIQKRQEAVKDAKVRIPHTQEAQQASKALRLGGSLSLPALEKAAVAAADTGMYTSLDALSTEALREIAGKHSLRDMAPLNTRGKYHARYIKNAYPIAGSQLALEKERELIFAAKKKLVLSKAESSGNAKVPNRSGGIGQSAYRKLDFYVDKFAAVLQHEQTHVRAADEQRRVRLVDVQHRDGLDQFWRLMHTQRYHQTQAWLKTHRFRDVNVPVVIRYTKPTTALRGDSSEQREIVVEPNKDVGLTPLMAACRLHSVELARSLLDQGAAVYLRTATGDTAAHFLFHDWHDAQLTTLRRTADALVKANDTHRILQLLASSTMDVNAQNAFGESVLQHCARLGLVDCVQLLLTHQADAHARDHTGKTALDYARTYHHENITRILLNYATLERITAKESERAQCQLLLQQGRGALTAGWSQSPEKLLSRLAVEDRRVGHLRNQFVDRHGAVIVCEDDDDDRANSGSET